MYSRQRGMKNGSKICSWSKPTGQLSCLPQRERRRESGADGDSSGRDAEPELSMRKGEAGCALGVRVGCVRAARMEEVRAVYLHLGVRSFGIEFKVISVGLLIAFVSFPLFFPH